jgi:hypothetical protein
LGLPVQEKSKAERLEADLQNRLQADAAQTPGNGAAEGEAKQPADIFEWLTTNAGVGLASSAVIDDNGGRTFVKVSNSLAQVGSPCTLQIATIENMTHYPAATASAATAWSTEGTKTTTLRMGDLVPDSIIVSLDGGRYFGLRLHTAGGRETIDISETFQGVAGTSSSQKHSNQFDLIAADQQYAERFKHAVDDLIKSCGGSAPKLTY